MLRGGTAVLTGRRSNFPADLYKAREARQAKSLKAQVIIIVVLILTTITITIMRTIAILAIVLVMALRGRRSGRSKAKVPDSVSTALRAWCCWQSFCGASERILGTL